MKFLRSVARKMPVLGNMVAQSDGYRALFRPPGHYYSPIPDFEDLQRRADEIWPPQVPKHIPGVALNESGQLAMLARLNAHYATQPFKDSATDDLRYSFDNQFFPYSDAIFLHCLMREVRPTRIVEIGSGWSSAVMLDTNSRFLACQTRLTFIEPDPVRLNILVRPYDNFDLINSRLQEADLSVCDALAAGDILFIDSSHVSKTGSDLHIVFFDILPRLAAGVYVHLHDIFFPFEMPRIYACRAWNEVYLLRAFLADNQTWEISLWPSFLERFHRETVKRGFPLALRESPGFPGIIGSSFWMRKCDC